MSNDITFKNKPTVEDSMKFSEGLIEPKKIQVGDIVCKCPDCEGNIIVKTGKYGIFYSCNRYPECKKVLQFEEVQELDR